MRVTLDTEMTLEDVAVLFEDMGWEYGGPKAYGVPDSDHLAEQLISMILDMDERGLVFLHRGRLAVVRDTEVPSTFQVLLELGYAYVGDYYEAEEC